MGGNLLVRAYFTAFSGHSAAAPGTAFLLALISIASILSYEESSSILAQLLIPLIERLTKMTFQKVLQIKLNIKTYFREAIKFYTFHD